MMILKIERKLYLEFDKKDLTDIKNSNGSTNYTRSAFSFCKEKWTMRHT